MWRARNYVIWVSRKSTCWSFQRHFAWNTVNCTLRDNLDYMCSEYSIKQGSGEQSSWLFFLRNQCIDFFTDSKNSHMLDFITHCTCQALRHFCRNWPGCLWLVSLREQYLTFVGIINKGVDDKCKELSYTRSQVKMNYIIIYTLIYFIPLHGFSEVLTNRKML